MPIHGAFGMARMVPSASEDLQRRISPSLEERGLLRSELIMRLNDACLTVEAHRVVHSPVLVLREIVSDATLMMILCSR